MNRLRFLNLAPYGIATIALLLRLIALPYAQIDTADAVSRLYIAWQWIEKPYWITNSIWPPLHLYLLGLFLKMVNDPVFASVLPELLLAVATTIPIFRFTRIEWGDRPAVIAALAWGFYPVGFRYSLMALADVPFAFFLSSSMCLLSLARRPSGTIYHASMAGIMLTLASGFRYEGWLLIPLLAWVMLPYWRRCVIFFLTSALFPIYWMGINWLSNGNPLYFEQQRRAWMSLEAYTVQNLSLIERIKTILFVPSALFWGLTPFFAFLCVLGVIRVLWHHHRARVWLVPISLMLVLLTYQTGTGELVEFVRYTLYIGMMLIPFGAAGLDNLISHFHSPLWGKLISLIVLVTMLPLSFLDRWKVLSPYIPGEVQAVPRLGQQISVVSEVINTYLQSEDGLIIDFWSWPQTYYIALMSRVPPTRIFIPPGAANQTLDFAQLKTFVQQYPNGLLLLSNSSSRMPPPKKNELTIKEGFILFLQPLAVWDNLSLFHYKLP